MNYNLISVHPSCLEMAQNVAKCVRLYAWQCADCKCCARCEDLADDDKMLFCDLCDRGYHIYCVGLKKVPTGILIVFVLLSLKIILYLILEIIIFVNF